MRDHGQASDNQQGGVSRWRDTIAAILAAYRRFLPVCALVIAAFLLWGGILFLFWLR